MDIGVEEIRKWHVEGNGWTDIGYHYVIRRNGKVEVGRPLERPGAHAKGYNSNSIAIAWVGGMASGSEEPEDNRTAAQNETMVNLIKELQQKFPGAALLGHRDLKGVNKDCPCFDVREWFVKECNTEKKVVEESGRSVKTVRPSTIFKYLLSITWKLWRHHRSSRQQ